MNLGWIAAALNPRDVAPHPNFMSVEPRSPYAMLGLLAQARWGDYLRLAEEARDLANRAEDSAADMRAVEAIRRSLDAETMADAVEELRLMIQTGSIDPACAVASALFASVAYSELDRHSDAVAVVRSALQNVDYSTQAGRLLRAVALQQVALRRLEMGIGGPDEAAEVRSLLTGLRVSELPTFATTKATRWRSAHALRLIADELDSVAHTHLVNLNRDWRSREWIELVRSPMTYLELQAVRTSEDALDRYLKDDFDSELGDRTTIVFRSSEPVQDGVYAALLHHELIGSYAHARSVRATLGRLRLLRDDPVDNCWAKRDGLRLLRQADERQSLVLAIRRLRASGPLESLLDDARQIVNTRSVANLRRVELDVLNGAAHLLSTVDADRALGAVLQWIETEPSSLRGWEASGVRHEAGWTTAVSLAAPAGRLDDVAIRLLAAATSANHDDQLTVMGLARATTGLEWEGVSEATRERWAMWLRGQSPVAAILANDVGPQLGITFTAPAEAPVERAASLLNRWYRQRSSPAPVELSGVAEGIVRSLAMTRQEAAQGVFSFGGISAADVAVGLALDLGLTELWPDLIDFLMDASVSTDDKGAALDRLATAGRAAVPPAVLERLGSQIRELMWPVAETHFGDRLQPFPPAVRVAIRFDLIEDVDLLAAVARLGGSFGVKGRVETARILAVAADSREDFVLGEALALQLSHDVDSVVRGEAGRCLAMMLANAQSHPDLLFGRVVELLKEDGLVVPLLVLRGLRFRASELHLTQELRDVIVGMAQGHVARGVRLQASAVLADTLRR